MIHSGQRPYWCGEGACKRGYFWRKHLRKHLLSVHGVVYQGGVHDSRGGGSGAHREDGAMDLGDDDEEDGPEEDEDEDEDDDGAMDANQHRNRPTSTLSNAKQRK